MDKLEDGKIYRVIYINRVTKVIKGRRIMSFVALVVIGDQNGNIGYGKSKSKDVPVSIKKAIFKANNNMVKINIVNNTLSCKSVGKFCATKIVMFPAKKGTGIIAGGASRSVFEVLGVKNVVAKCHGSSNPHNLLKATMDGLVNMLN